MRMGLEPFPSISHVFLTGMVGRPLSITFQSGLSLFQSSPFPTLTFRLGKDATYEYCNQPYVKLETGETQAGVSRLAKVKTVKSHVPKMQKN